MPTDPRLENTRVKAWEKQYPGSAEDIFEIWPDYPPTMRMVAEWKESWIETSPHQFRVVDYDPSQLFDGSGTVKAAVFETAKRCGIHPYFYEYWMHRYRSEKENESEPDYILNIGPRVAFYKDEHLIMFKLAWGMK